MVATRSGYSACCCGLRDEPQFATRPQYTRERRALKREWMGRNAPPWDSRVSREPPSRERGRVHELGVHTPERTAEETEKLRRAHMLLVVCSMSEEKPTGSQNRSCNLLQHVTSHQTDS